MRLPYPLFLLHSIFTFDDADESALDKFKVQAELLTRHGIGHTDGLYPGLNGLAVTRTAIFDSDARPAEDLWAWARKMMETAASGKLLE